MIKQNGKDLIDLNMFSVKLALKWLKQMLPEGQ